MNVRDQITTYKDEEQLQKAPPILPFELDKLINVLGDTFVCLAELRTMLANASKSPQINKAALSNLVTKIDDINKLVLDIPDDLSKIDI
tara:strand:+ start:497 stop:763 length:267 start_codon:yes stop_codon:yes gene_type:complete